MIESAAAKDPRWGAECRDAKALAILETLISEAGPAVVSGTWLDIGCGSGLIASELARHVKEIHGLDPEPWDRWPVLSTEHSNLHFHAGSFRDLPDDLPLGSVDVVICNQVYEHVDSPAELLSQLHLVLKPGGVCYFAGPNLLWPIEPHVFWPFVHWLPRTSAKSVMKLLGSNQADELDAFSVSCWRLRSWFRSNGFEVRNGLRARIVASLRSAGRIWVATWIGLVPGFLFVLAEPVAPGLVYLLRKSPECARRSP